MDINETVRANYTKIYRLAAVLTKTERDCRSVCEDACLRLARMKKPPQTEEQVSDELIRRTIAASKNKLVAAGIKRKTDSEVFSSGESKDVSAAYYGVRVLPKNSRAVVHLSAVEGMSDIEIARALKISAATVAHRRKSGEEMLRGIISSEGILENYIRANKTIEPNEMTAELTAADAENKMTPPSMKRALAILTAVVVIAAAVIITAAVVSGRDEKRVNISPSEATPTATTAGRVEDDNASRVVTIETVAPEETEIPTDEPTAEPTRKPTSAPAKTSAAKAATAAPEPTKAPEEASDTESEADEAENPETDGEISEAEGIPEELLNEFPKLSGFIYDSLVQGEDEMTCRYKGDSSKAVSVTRSAPIQAVDESAEATVINDAAVLLEDRSAEGESVFAARFNMNGFGYTLESSGCGKDEFTEILEELIEKLTER